MFDASVYNTDHETADFHRMIRDLSTTCEHAKPTEFHHTLKKLCVKNRLVRLYSQNMDELDAGPKTIQLHGGLGRMECHSCHTVSRLDASLFVGSVPPPCKNCQMKNEQRANEGKRQRGIGRLRPKILLYEEHNPAEKEVGTCIAENLKTRPDLMLVVGTSLRVPAVRQIVQDFEKSLVSDSGILVWLNTEGPRKSLNVNWDLVVQQDCQMVAKELNLQL